MAGGKNAVAHHSESIIETYGKKKEPTDADVDSLLLSLFAAISIESLPHISARAGTHM